MAYCNNDFVVRFLVLVVIAGGKTRVIVRSGRLYCRAAG